VSTSRGLRTALLFLLLALGLTAHAATLSGRVVGVADGDTLTLLLSTNKQVKVRLAEIDAPEKDQPWGQNAKKALSDQVFGQTVQIDVVDTDRYGRTVGRVMAGGKDINAEMIRTGNAWVYRQYLKNRALLAIEDEAKAARRGLWGLQADQRVPPWEWRRGKHSASTPPSPTVKAPANSSGLTCGSKRTCKEMSSCAEARFYLIQCGRGSLDRDKDGIPCESLCR